MKPKKTKKRRRETKAQRERRWANIATVLRTLVEIAAFHEGEPGARDITGMTTMDEPHAALKAREALDAIGYRHP